MAHTIVVSAGFVPNFDLVEVAGADVVIKAKLTTAGIDYDGIPRLRGTGPDVTGTVYVWDTADLRFEDEAGAALPTLSPAPTVADGPYLLYIPAFSITPTRNWQRPKNASYNFFFTLPNGATKPWEDMQDIRVDTSPDPTTWLQLSLYSKGTGPRMFIPMTYSREEVDALLASVQISAIENPMTAVGDLIRGGTVVDGIATATRLAIGSSGHFMKVSGGLPSWSALQSSEVTTALGFTPAQASHTHTTGDITGFTAAVDARITSGAIITALGYTPSATGHTHVAANITDFASAVNALITSGAVIAALGYTPSAVGHTHTASDVTDFASTVTAEAAAGWAALLTKVLNVNLQILAGSAAVASDATAVVLPTGTGAGAKTVTLPAASSSVGRLIIVVHGDPSGSAPVFTIAANGGDSIVKGAATVSSFTILNGQFAFMLCIDTGTWVLGRTDQI